MRLNRKMTAGHVLLLGLIWQAAAVPDGQAGSCYYANGTIKFGGFDTAAYGCDPPEPPPTTQAPPKAPPEAAPGAALSTLWDHVRGAIGLSPAVTDVAALHLALPKPKHNYVSSPFLGRTRHGRPIPASETEVSRRQRQVSRTSL